MDRLSKNETKTELPANFNQLKKSINRASNWRERLDAIEELGQWKTRETMQLLTYSMTGDPVYKVQEAAYRKLIALGEKVTLPERKTGELIKDTKKILLRLKKSLPENHSYEDFKEKVKKVRLDLYDVYEGEKGADFDKWLKENWEALSTR